LRAVLYADGGHDVADIKACLRLEGAEAKAAFRGKDRIVREIYNIGGKFSIALCVDVQKSLRVFRADTYLGVQAGLQSAQAEGEETKS
jgi:hypothetical protein